ncbi:hypothetical protein AOLI_G00166250 [Acnodon oligacanthus]
MLLFSVILEYELSQLPLLARTGMTAYREEAESEEVKTPPRWRGCNGRWVFMSLDCRTDSHRPLLRARW